MAIFELGWQMSATFVAAYLAYVVAYTGRRKHHKSIDSTFIILTFALIALSIVEILDSKVPAGNGFRVGIISACAVSGTVFSAVLWHAKVHGLVQGWLSKIKADQDDGFPTAWETIISEPGLAYSQVYVTLKDGRKLESYQMEPFNKLPNGPCILGLDGSIAMYVNAIKEPESERRDIETITDDDGHRITYIPADQIAEVDLRRVEK